MLARAVVPIAAVQPIHARNDEGKMEIQTLQHEGTKRMMNEDAWCSAGRSYRIKSNLILERSNWSTAPMKDHGGVGCVAPLTLGRPTRKQSRKQQLEDPNDDDSDVGHDQLVRNVAGTLGGFTVPNHNLYKTLCLGGAHAIVPTCRDDQRAATNGPRIPQIC